MNEQQMQTAQKCLEGAETNAMTFPQIVETLMEAGFESYAIDFRQATATYYLPDGACTRLSARRVDGPIALTFDAALLQVAIREAQQRVPGYTYKGFCRKAVAAGCSDYIVSFSGRRAVYIGRTAETHVEHFPDR